MGKSKKRISSQRQQLEVDGPAKVGPGQEFIREPIDDRVIGGPRRFNNVGSHPLNLAKARGKISSQQWAAGNKYRQMFEMRERSGHDSSQPHIPAGLPGTPFTQAQVDAIRWLQFVDGSMSRADRTIIRMFCGKGHSMVDSVRCGVKNFDPKSVVSRVNEALDELMDAMERAPRRAA
jgi:hypothetical protein